MGKDKSAKKEKRQKEAADGDAPAAEKQVEVSVIAKPLADDKLSKKVGVGKAALERA